MKKNNTQRTPQQRYDLYNRLHNIFKAIWLSLLLLNCVFFIVLYGLGVISSTWILTVVVVLSVVIIVASALVPVTNLLLDIVAVVYLTEMLFYGISGESLVWLRVVVIVFAIIMCAVYCSAIFFVDKLQKLNQAAVPSENKPDDADDIFDEYGQ